MIEWRRSWSSSSKRPSVRPASTSAGLSARNGHHGLDGGRIRWRGDEAVAGLEPWVQGHPLEAVFWAFALGFGMGLFME